MQGLRDKKKKMPMRVLIYGREGLGKTTFAACGKSTKTMLIDIEGGADYLPENGHWDATPKCNSFDEVFVWLRKLYTEEHNYTEVAIDSLDRLEDFVLAETVKAAGCKSIEEVGGGFFRGFAEALKWWQKILSALDALRAKGLAVCLVAHEGTSKQKPADSETYLTAAPKIQNLAADLICEWCDVVCRAQKDIALMQVDGMGSKKSGARSIARDVGASLRCGRTASIVAKNRIGLPELLPWAGPEARDVFDAEVAKRQK